MAISLGAGVWFGFSKSAQVAWTTPQTSLINFMPQHAGQFSRRDEPGFSQATRYGQATYARTDQVQVEGTIPFDWRHEGFEPLLNNGFTHSQTVPETGVYLHTYVLPVDNSFGNAGGSQLNGLTCYQGQQTRKLKFENMFLNGYRWAVSGNFLLFTPSFIGKERTVLSGATTPTDAAITPTFPTAPPAVVKGKMTTTVVVGGSTYNNVPTRGFNVNTPFPTAVHTEDATSYIAEASRSDRQIPEVGFAWQHHNTTTMMEKLRVAWEAKDPIKVIMRIEGNPIGASLDPEYTEFEFPYLVGGSDPTIGGVGALEQPYAWKAQRDEENSLPAMYLRMRNLISIT